MKIGMSERHKDQQPYWKLVFFVAERLIMTEINSQIWFERELLESEPFRKLTRAGLQVLVLFYCRRQMKWMKRTEYWKITNNGRIVLPYTDAIKRLSVAGKNPPSRKTITRAIDQLVKYGFIDIIHVGGGVKGDCSRYAISQRWREYGEEGFIVKTRQKDTRFGFTKENWEERTGRKRKEESTLGVKNDMGASVKNDTGHVNLAASLRPLEKGNIDVNHFIQKGELVLKAFRSSKSNQYQKGYHSIVFPSSPEYLAEALPTND